MKIMLIPCMHVYIQAEADAQRARADALQLEKESLTKQLAELREKLAKTAAELDEVKSAMENMVPRYAEMYHYLI